MTNFTGEPVLPSWSPSASRRHADRRLADRRKLRHRHELRSRAAAWHAALRRSSLYRPLGCVSLPPPLFFARLRHGIAAGPLVPGARRGAGVSSAAWPADRVARSDLVAPISTRRAIIPTAVLWVMFLACMATSVFFSFDSRFSPSSRRPARARRAAARPEPGQRHRRRHRRHHHAAAAQGNREPVRERRLAQPTTTSCDNSRPPAQADREIEKYFHDQIEERTAIKEQQERIATRQSGQAGLASKKTSLTDELARLKPTAPALADDYRARRPSSTHARKAIDAKRVEAMAEDGASKAPSRKARVPSIASAWTSWTSCRTRYKIQDDRVRDAKKRLDTLDTRLTQSNASWPRRRRARQMQGRSADRRAAHQDGARQRRPARMADRTSIPARVLPAFEKARVEFRQEPTARATRLVQQRARSSIDAMFATPATKAKVTGIDCDPKQASEAAATMFALNAGLNAFNEQLRGRRQARAASRPTDALFGFARKCLADSGLAQQGDRRAAHEDQLRRAESRRQGPPLRRRPGTPSRTATASPTSRSPSPSPSTASSSCPACSAPMPCARRCPTCRASKARLRAARGDHRERAAARHLRERPH